MDAPQAIEGLQMNGEGNAFHNWTLGLYEGHLRPADINSKGQHPKSL
jgi:hypothetical protein